MNECRLSKTQSNKMRLGTVIRGWELLTEDLAVITFPLTKDACPTCVTKAYHFEVWLDAQLLLAE